MKNYFSKNRRNFGKINLRKFAGKEFKKNLSAFAAALIGFSSATSTAVDNVSVIDSERNNPDSFAEKLNQSDIKQHSRSVTRKSNSKILVKMLYAIGITGVLALAMQLKPDVIRFETLLCDAKKYIKRYVSQGFETCEVKEKDKDVVQFETSVKARPGERADVWFKNLGGTQKDIDDYRSKKSETYEGECARVLKADLSRTNSDNMWPGLDKVEVGDEIAKTILFTATHTVAYYQGFDRIVYMLIYAFAKKDDEKWVITPEAEAKACFVYQKLAKYIGMMFKEIEQLQCVQRANYDQEVFLVFNEFLTMIMSGSIDFWGIQYSIEFWNRIMLRIPKHRNEEYKFIRESFFKVSIETVKSLSKSFFKVVNGELKPIHVVEHNMQFHVINNENSTMYYKILKKVFPM
jgi:hypothetical protein